MPEDAVACGARDADQLDAERTQPLRDGAADRSLAEDDDPPGRRARSPGTRPIRRGACASRAVGKPRSRARIAPTTHSASGMSNTPRALQTVTSSGTCPTSQSTPALSVWITRSRPGAASASSTAPRIEPSGTTMSTADRSKPGPSATHGRSSTRRRHLAHVADAVGIGGDADLERAGSATAIDRPWTNDVPSTTAVSRHLCPGRARQSAPA